MPLYINKLPDIGVEIVASVNVDNDDDPADKLTFDHLLVDVL